MVRGSCCWCWVSLCFPWKQMAPCRGNQYGTERGTLAKTMCKHEHKLCFTGALIHEDIKGVTCGTSPTTPWRSNCKLAALCSAGLVQHFPASGCLSELSSLGFLLGLVLPFLQGTTIPLSMVCSQDTVGDTGARARP